MAVAHQRHSGRLIRTAKAQDRSLGQFEGTFQPAGRLLEGQPLPRPPAGGQDVAEGRARLTTVARAVAVIGQRAEGLIVIAAERRDGISGAPVAHDSLADGKRVADGFLHQRVGEAVSRPPFRGNQPCRRGRLQGTRHRHQRCAKGRTQRQSAELPAQDRCRLQRPAGLRREPTQTISDHFSHRRRDELASDFRKLPRRRPQQPGHLHDEKRVTFGPRDNMVGHRLRDRTRVSGDQRPDLGISQAPQG